MPGAADVRDHSRSDQSGSIAPQRSVGTGKGRLPAGCDLTDHQRLIGDDRYPPVGPLKDAALVRRLFGFLLLSLLASACQREMHFTDAPPEEECKGAWVTAEAKVGTKSDFMKACSTADWVAVCQDGSASLGEHRSEICAHQTDVALWFRIPHA